MGQQTSRKSNASSCVCGCGGWERRARLDTTSHVQRYVAAVTDRWSGRECACRRRRFRRPACVCTGYRRVSDSCHDDRLATVLTIGARDLRRELDAIVINTGFRTRRETNGISLPQFKNPYSCPTKAPRQSRDSDQLSDSVVDTVNAEVYVLSVAPRGVETDGLDNRPQELGDQNSMRIPTFQVVCGGELRALLLRAPHLQSSLTQPANERVHTQVDYIHCLVPDLQEITACPFYWGKMDRYEAERLLDNKPEGTFLLRDSAQEEHLFSVSFRKYGRSLHARIEHYRQRFSFDSHDPAVFSASTVTALIEHYKDPACVMFFEPMLTAPLPRAEPFSLQQLARAVIVSHITYDGVEQLPLPTRLRGYLKQYHYRQRVRVRTLEH